MSDPKKYIRIRLSHLSDHLEDVVTQVAFDHGATGLAEALPYVQPDLTYDPEIVNTRSHTVDVFFTEQPAREFFDAVKNLSAQITWEIVEEETKDWLAEWKKGFVPFKLVDRFWIIPSWFEPPKECGQPIFIDPGMAFGTGTHATTQIAAHLVVKASEKRKEREIERMLDVGTGTAVLAMLGDHQGFGEVVGIEIDPEARRVAKENVALNKLKKITISDRTLEETKGPFSLVVANIIDGVLIQIKNDLIRVLDKNSDLIVTGILQEREALFFEKFIEATGMQVHRRIEKDEWVGFWLKPSSGK